MAAEAIWAALAKKLPQLKTPIQLTGAVVIVLGVVLSKGFGPETVPAFTAVGIIGGAILLFGLSLNSISRFRESQRAWFVLGMLCLTILGLLGCLGITLWRPQGEAEKLVDVTLISNGKLLKSSFSLTYTLPNREPLQAYGVNGHLAIRGVPRRVKSLQIDDVGCNGFEPKNGPEYEIVDGKVKIEMESVGPSAPWSIDELPNASPFVPNKEAVSKPPVVTPDKVLFTFINQTGDDLELLLYSCSAHYAKDAPFNDRMGFWLTRPFPASHSQEVFDQFTKGTGWYVVYVATKDRSCYRLDTVNLFQSENPTLVVKKTNDSESPYKGEWSHK